MTYLRDIQRQENRSAVRGSGRIVLFAEHLTKHVLQFSLFVGRKCRNFLLQPAFINRPYLVGDNLTVAYIHMTGHTIGIAVNSRCDGNDDDRGKVLVQLLWTHHYAGTHFLHLGTDCRGEVNPVDIKLIYHCQSSTLSSSKKSAVTSRSSPCLCALRAAADHPFLTAGLVTGFSVKTTLRISRRAVRAFYIATSLSKIGLSSRSSSARSCIAVIIVIVYRLYAAKIQIIIETQLKTK